MRDSTRFHEIVIIPERHGNYTVKGHGTYEKHSVLAGQTKIVFLDSFDSYEEAKAVYPEAVNSHNLLEPVNTFDHLSDEEGSY
jgi:hypothetical protein